MHSASLAPGYIQPEDRARTFILAMTPTMLHEVYFDDTGCNKEPVFMWCGYMARIDDWTPFSQAWRAILDEPPALPYWHSTDARAKPRPAPFDVLDDEQILDRERRLAQVISAHHDKITGFCIRLPAAYHGRYVAGKIKARIPLNMPNAAKKLIGLDVLERPHFVCFMMASLQAIGRMRHAVPGSVLNYFYEDREGDPYQRIVDRSWHVFQSIKPDYARSVGTLTFVPGKTGMAPPLEAADMLAWHMKFRADRTGVDDGMWRYICHPNLEVFPIPSVYLEHYVGTFDFDGLPQIKARGHKPKPGT